MENVSSQTTLEDAERRLRKACEMRAFAYCLHFSEVEGVYYASADGQGSKEFCEVKRASLLIDAIERLTARIEDEYPVP